MTETDNPSARNRLLSVALILSTLYICTFHDLGALGLIGPDEPRYAWIARTMAESGDWVTPRLYGSPWFEKPILYYWGAALSFKLFGVNEAAARLPSAFAALLAALSLAFLARRAYGRNTACWFLLLLPTSVGMLGFSHAAATDMPFTGSLIAAMVCSAFLLGLVRDEHSPILPRTPWLALALFGFFLGLATLAKGPAAIILLGGAILLWAFFTKRPRDAFRCLHPVAVAAFSLTALPWYGLCSRRNPDFVRVFILEHNFKRYLTPEFQHIQPLWFYIPILLLALFPWTVLLVPALSQLLRRYREGSPEFDLQFFLASLPLFTLVFFSLSQSKLPGYILPAVPPLLLLCSRWLASALEQKHAWLRWTIVSMGLCLLGFGLAFPFASQKLPAYTDIVPSPLAERLAEMGILGGLIVMVLAALRRYRPALLAMIAFLLVLTILVDVFLGKIDRGLTARTTAPQAQALCPDFSLEHSATWRVRRSLVYQLNFYAHSVVPEWQPGSPKPRWLLIEPAFAEEARSLGFSCPSRVTYPAVIPCEPR